MNEKLLALYEELAVYSKFVEEEDAQKFLDTLDAIVLQGDPSSIKELVKYFNDDCEYDIMQSSLTHAIEHYPDDVYVTEIIKSIDVFLKNNASECLVELFVRIFNNEKCLEYLKNCLNIVNKKSFLLILDMIEEYSPHHKEKIEELRLEMNKGTE